MKNYSSITLNNLELSVNLGWPRGERVKQQIVTLDVMIAFKNPPIACTSDILEDTFCYDSLIKTIKTELTERHFRLLEHLGCIIYQIIQNTLEGKALVKIKITKKPAILNLTGGVSFSFGDWES